MGIEDEAESMRDTERDMARLRRRTQALEAAVSRLAKERHDAAVASGIMRGHNVDFNRCMEPVCALAEAERGDEDE